MSGGPIDAFAAQIADLVDQAEPIAPNIPENIPGAPPPPVPPGEPPDDDGGDGAPPVDWELVRLCAKEPETDIGNGRRFLHRHGAEVLWAQRIGFLVFDGRRWAEDVQNKGVRPLAHRAIEAIALEAHVVEPTELEQQFIREAEDAFPTLRRLRKLGKRRTIEEDAEVERLQDIVDKGAEAETAIGKRKGKRASYAKSSGSKSKIDAMLIEAAPYVSHPLGDLDQDPLALNLENGTLRFLQLPDPECPDPDAGRLRWAVRLDGHDRADLISKLGPVAFDARAEAPQFERFIATVLPDPDVRAYLQRYFGYALTAWTREQVFVILHGEGRNGKSTVVDLICRILGDYSTSLPVATLINAGDARRGAEATPDLALLPGARLVRTAEPKEGLPLDESMVKTLTAGEEVPMRRLNQDFTMIRPTFKMVISVNRRPTIRGNDDGIWRRVSLVPFDVQIPLDQVDKELPEKLWAERSGVLNWLIDGALDYLGRGRLDPPAAVSLATGEYRDDSDIIGAFVRGALIVTKNPRDTATPGALYEAFVSFCKRQAYTPVGQNTFSRRMPKAAVQFGFEKSKASVVLYQGVEIRDEFRPETRGFV